MILDRLYFEAPHVSIGEEGKPIMKDMFNKILALFMGSGNSKDAGQIIHNGLKNEISGSKGDRVTILLLQSCGRRTLTSELSPQIIKFIYTEAIKCRRSSAIAKDLQVMVPETPSNVLELICKTVVSMAGTALARSRAEDMGLNWYHSERCRPSIRKGQKG
jgi:hypothetical protein